MGRSALVVLIPEAEPAMSEVRQRHDPMSARGVPAHVTVLHPFRPELDDAATATIGAICAAAAPFSARFAEVRQFAGGVVYLAPEPAAPFAALTTACVAAFPDCPPYGGAHPDPVPHLTVGSGLDATVTAAVLATAAWALPVHAAIEQLTRLVEDDAGRWTVDRHWPLGGR